MEDFEVIGSIHDKEWQEKLNLEYKQLYNITSKLEVKGNIHDPDCPCYKRNITTNNILFKDKYEY